MAENTAIEWADHSFNPWLGCTKVSPGCDHCYAERERATRILGVKWGAGEPRHRTAVSTWRKPKRWNAAHATFFAEHGRRQRVFCASLSDVFDNDVPAAWRADLLRLIAQTPDLDWLILTKRIGNARAMLNEAVQEMTSGAKTWDGNPWPNVWLGATVVDQREADRDIPKLLETPAAVKFLSMEPLLGPVDISDFLTLGWPRCETSFVQSTRYEEGYCATCAGHVSDPIHQPGMHDVIDWVIAGGESGPGARPMHTHWARALRDQCALARVPFLFKQWGEWLPADQADGMQRDAARVAGSLSSSGELRLASDAAIFQPGDTYTLGIGKKLAGRLLDGRTHDGFPVHKERYPRQPTPVAAPV
ncbi:MULTISPECIES: phage Gp37/Gp68 family protein [Paraburkholderia]|uniref:phage Gp37/Gp68 family protein n=1 Tax=Paraburkholderia TaxID=1822464 RepID=UPI002AAF7B80|nr:MULTISPECIES: phage Gp37/Gp68 family protein [Paraburkholderia]